MSPHRRDFKRRRKSKFKHRFHSKYSRMSRSSKKLMLSLLLHNTATRNITSITTISSSCNKKPEKQRHNQNHQKKKDHFADFSSITPPCSTFLLSFFILLSRKMSTEKDKVLERRKVTKKKDHGIQKKVVQCIFSYSRNVHSSESDDGFEEAASAIAANIIITVGNTTATTTASAITCNVKLLFLLDHRHTSTLTWDRNIFTASTMYHFLDLLRLLTKPEELIFKESLNEYVCSDFVDEEEDERRHHHHHYYHQYSIPNTTFTTSISSSPPATTSTLDKYKIKSEHSLVLVMMLLKAATITAEKVEEGKQCFITGSCCCDCFTDFSSSRSSTRTSSSTYIKNTREGTSSLCHPSVVVVCSSPPRYYRRDYHYSIYYSGLSLARNLLQPTSNNLSKTLMTVSILPPILISSLKAKEAAIVSSSSSVTPPPPQPSLFSLTAVSPSSCFTCEENLQKFTFCSSSLSSVVECSSPIISSVPLPPPPCMQYPLRLKPKLGVPSYPSTSSSSLSFIHQLKLLLLVLLSWLLVSFMKTVLQFPENFKTLLSFVSRKTLNLSWSCEQHSKYYVSHHSSLPSVVKPLQMKLTETRTDGKGNPKRRKTSSININSSSHHHHISKSYKLLYGKDFIYVIALSLCLLSPSMASVITSNEIFPMDAASSQADRDVNGELSIPVEGVVGKRIELPCDISPSRRDDTVYMVLWFRGEESIPIYSLDVRGKHVGGGKPWSAEKPFGKRAYFQSTSEPARLIVEGAQISDQGIYRCRVDFRNSPSREARLNLTTIVPPNEPQIYDATGMSTRGEIGPFIEGSIVELTCIVREGVPSPMVQWYLNDELVDSSYHVKNDKEVINHISVPNIQRSLQRASLSCRASNTLLVPPVTKTVYFELNLRPLTVSIPIKHRNPQLTAETQYEIKCESWGSHPPPMMTWWLDGREEKGASIEESKGSNNTVSRLFFTPNASNDGQVLTCRVENPHVTAGALEDSWKLRVSYPPVLHLRMGSSLNPRDIKEGDDVYFECHIRANPQVHKLAWYHNGLLLHHNRSAGVILSNQSLVLQKVTRPSAGNYSCRASNVQGEGNSNNVILNIMYAPACQSDLSGTDAAIIIAASRSEVINITCEMDALPNKLTFQWTHTNTVGENAELESDMYTSAGSKSLLRYHLRSEEDFGTILCWASNSIGDAERPCIYQLVPADVPQPVENCSIINRTSTSVEITCEPGFDGGLPQSFLFEAYQTSPTERRGLFTNITLDKPTFALSRLDTDGTFHFKIYSVNRKGRSSASIMDGIVLRYPVMQSAKTRDLEKTTVAIIIGAASAVTLGFISLIAFIIHRIRHPISAGEMEKSYSREFGSNRRGEDDDFYRNDMKNPVMGITFTGNSNFDEDGDPDLIPTSKNVKAAAMGSVYSRLSNGEINQRYVASSGAAAQECMDPPSLSLSSMQCTTAAIEDPYNSQAMPNYATCRGKPNGLGLKEQHPLQHLPQKQNQQQQHRPMVSSSSTSFQRGKSSTLVVNIDTRLIGQQLASSHLPESCV